MKKKLLYTIIFLFILKISYGQIGFRYGINGGVNISTAILPELQLNTDINSILKGDDVVQGSPQLADYTTLYKAGIFARVDGRIASLKFSIDYDKTKIYKKVDIAIFSVDALHINLSYIDFNMTANLNIFKHFYLTAGYVPSFLIEHEGNLDINDFDQRFITGFGFRLVNGVTLDFDAVIGLDEVIDGSYIHNVMIPITISIPFN